jgi:hypothetical protein
MRVSQPCNVARFDGAVLRLLPDLAFGAGHQALDVFAVHVDQEQGEHGEQRGKRNLSVPPQEQRRDDARDQRRG